MNTTGTAARRLAEAVRCTADIDLHAVGDAFFREPHQPARFLDIALAGTTGRVHLAGLLTRHRSGGWTPLADLAWSRACRGVNR
jgi:hypothetical protein